MDCVEVHSQMGIPADAKNMDNVTPLHLASSNGYFDTVLLLLEKGAFVNSKARNGRTPLVDAVLNQHLNVVALLLKHGGRSR